MNTTETVNLICREVAELPDRNSPADLPEAMLVTRDELAQIVTSALERMWKSKAITLSALQLHEALEFAAPDYDNDESQRETDVCVAWAPENTVSNDEGGFEAPGYVVWLEEYPEEGCMPLDGGNPRPLTAIENERSRKARG
jgi:hypothetical protein